MVAPFDTNPRDLQGDHCYALVIDFEIPDEVKLKTDNLPMNFSQELIEIDQASDFTKDLIEMTGCNFKKTEIIDCLVQQSRWLSNFIELIEAVY